MAKKPTLSYDQALAGAKLAGDLRGGSAALGTEGEDSCRKLLKACLDILNQYAGG